MCRYWGYGKLGSSGVVGDGTQKLFPFTCKLKHAYRELSAKFDTS